MAKLPKTITQGMWLSVVSYLGTTTILWSLMISCMSRFTKTKKLRNDLGTAERASALPPQNTAGVKWKLRENLRLHCGSRSVLSYLVQETNFSRHSGNVSCCILTYKNEKSDVRVLIFYLTWLDTDIWWVCGLVRIKEQALWRHVHVRER